MRVQYARTNAGFPFIFISYHIHIPSFPPPTLSLGTQCKIRDSVLRAAQVHSRTCKITQGSVRKARSRKWSSRAPRGVLNGAALPSKLSCESDGGCRIRNSRCGDLVDGFPFTLPNGLRQILVSAPEDYPLHDDTPEQRLDSPNVVSCVHLFE